MEDGRGDLKAVEFHGNKDANRCAQQQLVAVVVVLSMINDKIRALLLCIGVQVVLGQDGAMPQLRKLKVRVRAPGSLALGPWCLQGTLPPANHCTKQHPCSPGGPEVCPTHSQSPCCFGGFSGICPNGIALICYSPVNTCLSLADSVTPPPPATLCHVFALLLLVDRGLGGLRTATRRIALRVAR